MIPFPHRVGLDSFVNRTLLRFSLSNIKTCLFWNIKVTNTPGRERTLYHSTMYKHRLHLFSSTIEQTSAAVILGKLSDGGLVIRGKVEVQPLFFPEPAHQAFIEAWLEQLSFSSYWCVEKLQAIPGVQEDGPGRWCCVGYNQLEGDSLKVQNHVFKKKFPFISTPLLISHVCFCSLCVYTPLYI